MTNEQQKTTVSEICTIRIIFPVESDEQAIEYKKKIKEILSDKPDAQMQFIIAPNLPAMPMR